MSAGRRWTPARAWAPCLNLFLFVWRSLGFFSRKVWLCLTRWLTPPALVFCPPAHLCFPPLACFVYPTIHLPSSPCCAQPTYLVFCLTGSRGTWDRKAAERVLGMGRDGGAPVLSLLDSFAVKIKVECLCRLCCTQVFLRVHVNETFCAVSFSLSTLISHSLSHTQRLCGGMYLITSLSVRYTFHDKCVMLATHSRTCLCAN